jgi:hypothetical protein
MALARTDRLEVDGRGRVAISPSPQRNGTPTRCRVALPPRGTGTRGGAGDGGASASGTDEYNGRVSALASLFSPVISRHLLRAVPAGSWSGRRRGNPPGVGSGNSGARNNAAHAGLGSGAPDRRGVRHPQKGALAVWLAAVRSQATLWPRCADWPP